MGQHFNGAPQNIGVQMGQKSKGLTDVDLDSPEALALAEAFLPPTNTVFGRSSTPRAHQLYISNLAATEDRAAIKFYDPRQRKGEEALILELRIGGAGKAAQTVFPPSAHKETGEPITWAEGGDPAVVDGADLLKAVQVLSACSLLARYWPATGGGCHDTALIVGGFLARAGLTADAVRDTVEAIAQFSNPERAEELSRTAGDAADAHNDGERAYGLPELAKTFGDDVAKEVAEWLDYSTTKASADRSTEDWPEPTPPPSGLSPVPALDPEMLPDKLRPWLEDIADRMQVPLDFVSVPAMAVFGSVIGCKVGIHPKRQDDWTEVANLWAMIIARPGFMKSPAVSEILRPMQRSAESAAATYSGLVKEYEMDADIHKHKRGVAVKKGERFTDPEPDEPVQRRFFTNDSTYEKLCEILRDNPSGTLLHRDEIVSLLRYLDREENSQARGFYLTAWSGMQRYDSDRIGRGAIHVDHACVAVVGTTQPGTISEYVRRATVGGRGDDGMIQRFGLAVWPDTSPKWENVDRYPLKEPRDAVWKVFKDLDGATPDTFGAVKEEFDRIPWLRFTPEAQALFDPWRERLEARVRGGELHPAIESRIAKYRGLVPRLALITHLIDAGHGAVDEMALLKALMWSEYLEAHALRLYGAGAEPGRAAAGPSSAKCAPARSRIGSRQGTYTGMNGPA